MQLFSLEADVPRRVFSALDSMVVEVETAAVFLGHAVERVDLGGGIVEVVCDCDCSCAVDEVNVFDSYLLDGPCPHEALRAERVA